MLDWLRNKPSAAPVAPVAPVASDAATRELTEALRRLSAQADDNAALLRESRAELERLRAESGDTAESLKKLARSFGRTALRVEEIERKLDDSIAKPAGERDASALFDALDLLEQAVAALDRAAAPELATGLDGVHARLLRHLGSEGFQRVASLRAPPDGTLVRVVGTVDAPDATPGDVVAVVRAAIKQGSRLVREGEVITARDPNPTP